ncbi:hypothetical protein BaRGS_00015915 [Batillaria attramentaria]|uniref:Uncharacterized protein n=1 Tax=Batillaria attramentaria TaxID=370345 RepID=A0ABD0L152_9CAEN
MCRSFVTVVPPWIQYSSIQTVSVLSWIQYSSVQDVSLPCQCATVVCGVSHQNLFAFSSCRLRGHYLTGLCASPFQEICKKQGQ